ncbi:MAG: hydroxymethylbilane synthase [Pirellulales bacterium]
MFTDASSHRPTLRLGTRGSKLARSQADWVANRLQQLGHKVDLIEIATHGDADANVPISSFGGTGVFTKEIQRALLAGQIDLTVHSLKDLPTDAVEGLVLAAIPPRESAADVLVVTAGSREQGAGSFSMLPAPCSLLPLAARVGTGSLRRQAQLMHARPDLRVSEVRGNVDTRLRKLDDGQFDALILAEAGLVRLGLADRITQVLSPAVMLPAVGQGALAIECRTDDEETHAAVAQLDDSATRAAVLAERSLLAQVRGGCLAPIGAWGRIEQSVLQLSAVVLSLDGGQRLHAHGSSIVEVAAAIALGRSVAEMLLAQGAADLIAAARNR